MECSIGLCLNDFLMVATDRTNARSILVMKDDQQKSYQLSDKLIMTAVGESGDTNQFAEFITKNIQLYKMQNGYELSPSGAANFTRRNLADYLTSMVKAPYAAHGYGGFFTTALLDRHFRKDL